MKLEILFITHTEKNRDQRGGFYGNPNKKYSNYYYTHNFFRLKLRMSSFCGSSTATFLHYGPIWWWKYLFISTKKKVKLLQKADRWFITSILRYFSHYEQQIKFYFYMPFWTTIDIKWENLNSVCVCYKWTRNKFGRTLGIFLLDISTWAHYYGYYKW